ncbi:MAG: T9SS type A sorting domain-containing protein, partial [Bacteroidia bacterium]|nr:T9SS type A sorting domain-containing protein [Bacteroidia bacterium]
LCDSLTLLKLNTGNVKNGVVLYPNPSSTSTFFLTFSSDYPLVNILVSDSKGNIVSTKQIADIKSNNPFEFKLNEPEPGVYIIQVSFGHKTSTFKVVFL